MSRRRKASYAPFLTLFYRETPSFSKRFIQRLASRRTFDGEVPPRLLRLFADRAGSRTSNRSSVIRGSALCRSESCNLLRFILFFSASATMLPVMWCASLKGMSRVCTSQSARSVAVECSLPAAFYMAFASTTRSEIIPVRAEIPSFRASRASKTGSLSSCMSLA